VQELQSPELRELIGSKIGIDLKDRPSMITLRGHTTERDGHIHVDSESKLVTVLLYLNPNWKDSGGKLRLLYNRRDLHNYAAEIPPEAGRCVVFKVTPNCWHGHEIFVGERKSIQLNYVSSDKERIRHLKRHRLSAFLKGLFFKKNEANSTY
jgi:Rps23 Pro-64 3,4-dihydroxylase Tpa1-like proline 4-hydroxylase